jgi:hypothetical protein
LKVENKNANKKCEKIIMLLMKTEAADNNDSVQRPKIKKIIKSNQIKQNQMCLKNEI